VILFELLTQFIFKLGSLLQNQLQFKFCLWISSSIFIWRLLQFAIDLEFLVSFNVVSSSLIVKSTSNPTFLFLFWFQQEFILFFPFKLTANLSTNHYFDFSTSNFDCSDFKSCFYFPTSISTIYLIFAKNYFSMNFDSSAYFGVHYWGCVVLSKVFTIFIV
jgi:hypothetical protein